MPLQGVDTYGLELAHLYAEQKNPRALEICDFILKQDSLRLLIDPFFIKGIYFANVKQYPRAIYSLIPALPATGKRPMLTWKKGGLISR